MCASEVKTKTFKVSKDHAQHFDDLKKEDKGKEVKKSEEKFLLIDPDYMHWFWPVY